MPPEVGHIAAIRNTSTILTNNNFFKISIGDIICFVSKENIFYSYTLEQIINLNGESMGIPVGVVVIPPGFTPDGYIRIIPIANYSHYKFRNTKDEITQLPHMFY